MNTQKVAITMPTDLVSIIDEISKRQGVSRSKFISNVVREKIVLERKRLVKDAYDAVFADEAVCREQLETAGWFEGGEVNEGQEW
jgi:hypothetical protein